MRKLMIFSLSFAAATALSHYLLPLSALPAAGGIALAVFLVRWLAAAKKRRRYGGSRWRKW